MSFFQTPPVLGNQYLDDRVLQSVLRRRIPATALAAITPELERMGARAVGDLAVIAATGRGDEPELVQWDAWGNRVDEVRRAGGLGGLRPRRCRGRSGRDCLRARPW